MVVDMPIIANRPAACTAAPIPNDPTIAAPSNKAPKPKAPKLIAMLLDQSRDGNLEYSPSETILETAKTVADIYKM